MVVLMQYPLAPTKMVDTQCLNHGHRTNPRVHTVHDLAAFKITYQTVDFTAETMGTLTELFKTLTYRGY